ncbi:hypothetical protein A2331_03635 [Candidatus Falkowbacteria bacterium RIFOXYB2_FULL_34_18]|uniref:ABC transmembrane type-1 domain-containing protein n=1 Tax=Candidatus Falkowbacteria bacterium RIFOXYD2_FULL_34_120 TaxID=1798007 RepID=A0A1F5TS93_9BACT|nr:MAG: hypothetical protein A2331_03635 [Candidatus Falkowbacteria bacterium RIFOXYB2_FULL_34_18]OGF30087.1 MAG: hypothetical protein A2500_04815 [Candidatus Falkowbacteria bacterium RIFOXYC12_FULL_34_55]OGF37579.1 MAG: hypothetical protein A2466_02030 [Candidatus Falkowbacteria bacterium RIFOXYC2_FULL_34_220]OGF39335.1 MAG: hypothetical protein A2515_02445 [Candidatus Falkowbacteria bacterium RIFOXYD12_FULL_34_57]OGF41840.1 MAG: hypothetical protein A2531_05430 [Candidatus Falkowbacteria bact
MKSFLLKRLIQIPFILLLISFMSFMVLQLAPGDFFTAMQMNPQISAETIAEMSAKYGFDKPLMVQYILWLKGIVCGDFGQSLSYHVSVVQLIGSRLVSTVILSFCSILFTWVLAFPLGVIIALKANTILDRGLSFFAFLGMSMPSFFFAFLLLLLALHTGWFPIGGTFSSDYFDLSLWGKIIDRGRHLVIPVLVLGLGGMGSLMRVMRTQVLEIVNADFVNAARARGLSEWRVILKHVVRNAINPFVTGIGYLFGALVSGAALVEIVLNLQGLGTLVLTAVQSQDQFVIMGVLLISGCLLLVGVLIADILLTLVDPRITFKKLEG